MPYLLLFVDLFVADSLDYAHDRLRCNSDVFLDIDHTPPDTDSEKEGEASV